MASPGEGAQGGAQGEEVLMNRHVILNARNGAIFMGQSEVEADGSLTVLTTDGTGHRSAHRDHAQKHFAGQVLWCMNRLSWVNTDGVRVVLTRWNTQEFRTASAARC